MKYTFISVPALGNKQNTFLNIKAKLTEYAETNAFPIPEFKVTKEEEARQWTDNVCLIPY